MLKKLIAGIVIILLLVTQLVPLGVFGANSDLEAALKELQQLGSARQAAILGSIWEYAAKEKVDGEPVSPDTIYDGISKSFGDDWSKMVNVDPPTDPNKIEKSSLMLIINKVYERRDVIKGMYDSFIATYDGLGATLKDMVKAIVCPDVPNPTDAQVYAGILTSVKEVVTSEVKNGKTIFKASSANPAVDILVQLLGMNADAVEALAKTVLGDRYFDSVNGTVNHYTDTLNDYIAEFNVDPENVILALNIYGLYRAPVVVSPLPSPSPTPTPNTNNPSGPGGPSDEATPTPVPSAAANETQLVDNLNKGIDDINNEPDPGKALDKALGLISGAAATMHELANNGLSIQSAIQALEKAANAALAKVNTETVTATVSAGTSTAVIDTAASNALIAKLDKIVTTASQLNAELAKASTDAKIEAVLNIKVNTGNEAVTASSAQLPTALLKAAGEKGIDKIAIDTGVATITIVPDAIAAGDQTAVTLSAAKVNTAALSPEEQAVVGSNQVYEFTAMAGTTPVTNFSKPVEITVPYTLKPGETGDNISVFFVNAQKQLENVMGTYDPVTKTVTFSTPHFSKYIVKENKVIFSDLGKVEWARLNIESMAAKGIITGVPGGKFAPTDSLTRAQFAALIVRTYNLEDAAATNTFSDVKSADWFYKPVMIAYKAGIVTGLTDGRFDPNGKVTREQMAAMVARALVKVKGKDLAADAGKYTAKFVDKGSISSFAVNESNLVAKYGIMSGKPGNAFDPKGNASRVEAAVVMYRLFNVK